MPRIPRPSIAPLPTLALAALGALSSGACASKGAPSPQTAATPAPAAAATAAGATAVRLIGTFSPAMQRTGALAPTQQVKTFGSLTLTPIPGEKRTHVSLDLTVPSQGVQLNWAVYPGGCGASTVPLLAVNVFPVIDVAANGHGKVEADIPLELPLQGQLHAKVFNEGSGQNIENVLTCASLRIDRGKGK